MKKILLFILLMFNINLINAIEYKDYTFLGSINDENYKKYNDIEIKILGKNGSQYFDKDGNECITTSTDFENPDIEYETNHGTFYMNCNLPSNQTFDIYFSKDGKIIKILEFITNKNLFVIGIEKYHDIQFGVYSKDPNKFLFSEEVIEKQYAEYLPWSKYTPEEIEKYQSEKIINFEFTCNNGRLIEKYLPYEIRSKNNKLITDGLFLQFIPVSILKGEELKLIYWDGKDKKTINVNYDMKDGIEINYLLYNCDSTNSKYNSNVLIGNNDNIKDDYDNNNIDNENNLSDNENIEDFNTTEIKENNNNSIENIIPKDYSYEIYTLGDLLKSDKEKTNFSSQYINTTGKLTIFKKGKIIYNEDIKITSKLDLSIFVNNYEMKMTFLMFISIFSLFLFIVISFLLKIKKRNKKDI